MGVTKKVAEDYQEDLRINTDWEEYYESGEPEKESLFKVIVSVLLFIQVAMFWAIGEVLATILFVIYFPIRCIYNGFKDRTNRMLRFTYKKIL
jgi:hypothetical protein